MELKRLLAIGALLALAISAPAQTPPSTVNPLIPIASQPVEQSGPALRQNFLATMNDINALYGRIVNGRTKLSAPLTLFADFVNGTNSTTCGLASGAAACKTVQVAYNNLVLNYDTAGQTVTISFNNNDTVGLSIQTSWVGGGPVTIQGPGGSPPSIGITATGTAVLNSAPLPAQLTLKDFKITSSGGNAVWNFAQGTININNINFGTVTNQHLQSSGSGSTISCIGPYTISGNAAMHWLGAATGLINCNVAITLTGMPAFSLAFAEALVSGVVQVPGATFSGSATGVRYVINLNSIINTTSGNPNFLPGNSPGTISSGGQYQ